MIIMIPMLCSNTVNYSAVPGIAKAMERNILIHGLDFVLGLQNEKTFKSKGGKIEANENLTIDMNNINLENFHILDETSEEFDINNESIYIQEELKDDPYGGMTQEEMEDEIERVKNEYKNTENSEDAEDVKSKQEELETRLKELEGKKKQVQDSTTRISMQMEGLSLEPTWMHVDRIIDGEKVTDLLGIKVLPFMVQSDEKLINLLTYDKHLKKFDAKIVQLGRKVKRYVYDKYKIAMNRIPVVKHFLGGRGSISGNIKKDVILAKSSFRNNIILCLNKLDFEDDFFKSTSGINKLFKMGWNSIVAMDDSQKTAYFCLQEYKGICFPVQYSYIFSTLGKEQKRVFDDLNDLKKSSGGLFRRKVPKRKLMENEIKRTYINDSDSIQGFADLEKFLLQENFSNNKDKKEIMEGIREIKDFTSTLKTGDKHKIQANLKRKTKYKDFSGIKKDMSKYPGFKKGYDFGKSHFKKKFDFSSSKSMRILEGLATVVGIYALRDYVSGNMSSMKHTTEFVNKLEKRINKNKNKIEMKEKVQDSDYIIGMSVFLSICAFIAPIVITIAYVLVKNPQIFTGIFSLFVEAIMFVLLAIHWIIFDFLAPITKALTQIADFIVYAIKKIGEFLKMIQHGSEKVETAFDDLFSTNLFDWLF